MKKNYNNASEFVRSRPIIKQVYARFFAFGAPVMLFSLVAAFPFNCTSGSDAGVWRSLDQGETWEQKTAISQKQSIASLNVLNLTIDPRDSNILYLGAEKAGIYKSMDNSETWYPLAGKNSNLKNNASVHAIGVDSKNNSNVYAAVLQDDFGKVFKSTDAGRSWFEVYRSSRNGYAVLDVLIDPADSQVVYIGTAEGGFLKSVDGGSNWRVLKWFEAPVDDIKIDFTDRRIIYAVVESRGIFKSTDGGASWVELAGLKTFPEAGTVNALVMDTKNASLLFAGSKTGLLRTFDGGNTWQRVNIVIPPESVPVSAIAVDPANSNLLYYGAGNVIYKSHDNGATWSVHTVGGERNISAICIDYQDTKMIFVGMGKAAESGVFGGF